LEETLMGGKHHHHHGGHGRRGFRRFRGGPVAFDYGPDVFEPACVLAIGPEGRATWTCPPYEAGHIPFADTMGIFGASDAQKTAVTAEDGNWTALFAAMIASLGAGKVNSAYTNAFTDKRAGWLIFKDSILRGASMSDDEFTSQLDSWKSERSAWAQDLGKKTGIDIPIISAAPPPKQENPDSLSNLLGKSTGLLVAGAALAAILVFGGRSRHAYY
jgi:hypothetical protein